MRNILFRKLKSRKGVSLGEVLVSVLILLLATMAVVSGVQAALRVYQRVRLQSESETMLSTAINTISSDLYRAKGPKKVSISDDSQAGSSSGSSKSVYIFQSENRNYGDYYMYFRNTGSATDASDSEIERVVCEEDGTLQKTYPVLAAKTQSLKLHAKLVDQEGSTKSGYVSYANGVYTFTVAILDQKESHIYASQTVTIRSLLEDSFD
ncbi:hypothetical protein ACKX2L_03070 [Lachnospiraceae bacterium YH-ros2228]